MGDLFRVIQSETPTAVHPIELRTWVQNLLDSTLIPSPFSQTGWEVPARYVHPIALRTFTNSPYADYLYSPFAQSEWPVPKGRPFPTDIRGFFNPIFNPVINLVFAVRRMERTTPGSAQRQEVARAERTAPGVGRRVDE